MKINRHIPEPRTDQGAVASRINPELQLRRSVMACLLWEDAFYEEGVSIADRIAALIPKVEAEAVQRIALEARNQMKLRHVPLLIVREMARLASHRHLVSKTLAEVIQRPDELAEFLAIYWKEKTASPTGNSRISMAGAKPCWITFGTVKLAPKKITKQSGRRRIVSAF